MNTQSAQNDTLPKKPGPAEDLLTLAELATRLKMHPDSVRGLKRRGVIPALSIGHRTLRFSWPDVLAALREAAQ